MTTRWRQFLFWWSGWLPLRTIMAGADTERRSDALMASDHLTPLFERYYVGSCFGYTVYLHHYLRSDPDAAPHNHPWPWALVIPLAGGYWERRPLRISEAGLVLRDTWRRPFKPYVLTENTYHRVIAKPFLTNWSLFIHTQRSGQGWGFLRQFPLRHGTANSDVNAWKTPQAVWFEKAIDGTSSEALGCPWHTTVPKGRDCGRAAP